MKRSEINAILREGIEFMKEKQFMLPGFAYWSPEEWAKKGHGADGIREDQLGWDITDYGSGNFYKKGLFLFTLRNGNPYNPENHKTYAEKIMIVHEDQVTPYHFHWHKMEDIINRGGGNLMIKIYNATPTETLADTPVTACLDGEKKTVEAGTVICLKPGDSITLQPYQYHSFWAEKGLGPVLTGEVSQVNDDKKDNRFIDTQSRFPVIVEDEKPLYLLVSEYPAAR